MRTCIGAKIGRNGQRCKSVGKKRESGWCFARKVDVGRTDRGRCPCALDCARGLARKSCGKSRKSGCVSVRCSPFSCGTSRRLRDGRATWLRFRSWLFAPQAPGGAAAERIVALCLLRGGSGGADGDCCAASTKATKGAVGLRRRNKKRLGQSGDCLSRWRSGRPRCGGTFRRFDTMPHDCRGCPATERGMLHAEKRG